MWFFEKNKKTDQSQAKLIIKEREKITKYQFQKWKMKIISDLTDIKRLIREYYYQV